MERTDRMHTPAHDFHWATSSADAMVKAAFVTAVGATGTAPLWKQYLHSVSEIAAELGPIVALVTAILTAAKLMGFDFGGLFRRVWQGFLALLAAVGILSLVAYALNHRSQPAIQPLLSQTTTATRKRKAQDDDGGNDGIAVFDHDDADPPWMKVAANWTDVANEDTPAGRRKIGEIFALAHHEELTAKDASTTPWCAAAACAAFEDKSVGIRSPRSLRARSFDDWGIECEPKRGAVVVLQRGGKSSGLGHVGFWVGENDTHVFLLGGNQGDRMCVAKFPKSRVVAVRWPAKWRQVEGAKPNVLNVAAQAGATGLGVAGVALSDDKPSAPAVDPGAVADTLEKSQSALQQIVPYFPKIALAVGVIGLAISVLLLWNHFKGHKA